MNSLIRILFALIACVIAAPALAAVSATLDRDSIASGETVLLRLQRDGDTDSQPDLGPLKRDFDVLGNSSGSNVQIINGHISSQTQVTVVLSPKHDGKIQIPPLHWGDQQSRELELSVGGNGNANRQGDKGTADNSHVFLTTALDQKQPYVQAADVLTVRLYTDQRLDQATLDFPASSDILVKQIGKDKQEIETRNGRRYRVIERKYLLFPQRSGKLSLDGPVLDAQVQGTGGNEPFGNDPIFGNFFAQMPFAGMMNPTRPIRLHAGTIELNVLPRPANATGANWLPAQKVTLQESWQPETTTMHVGEPLTRHLHMTALGLTGAQLPDLGSLMSVPDGVKAYPDQSKADDAIQGDTVLGSRDQDIALIAAIPGHLELPAVRLAWWDTVHNMQREIILPARALDVLPAAGGIATSVMLPPANPEQKNQSPIDVHAGANGQISQNANTGLWVWASTVLALLWLGTVLAWWHTHRRGQPRQTGNVKDEQAPAVIQSSGAFKAFRSACLKGDAHDARRHLLAWARSAWPAQPPAGLNELSRRLGDADLIPALRQLDRACTMGSAWDGELLARLLPAPPVLANSGKNMHGLPELYS